MRVGILGSGLMGGKLGTLFARAGHAVVFSYARSTEKLKRLAKDAGGNARAGTPREDAQDADALLLAVHWSRIDDVLSQTGDLSGKVIVTCSLPMNPDNTGLVIGHTSSGAEALGKRVPKARVVCAFNTVPSEVLFVIASRSRCSSPNSRTRGMKARTLRTGSSGLGSERHSRDHLTVSQAGESHTTYELHLISINLSNDTQGFPPQLRFSKTLFSQPKSCLSATSRLSVPALTFKLPAYPLKSGIVRSILGLPASKWHISNGGMPMRFRIITMVLAVGLLWGSSLPREAVSGGPALMGLMGRMASVDGGGDTNIDLAVRQVTVTPVRAYVGDKVHVEVLIENKAEGMRTTNADIYANGKRVGRQLFTWGMSPGNRLYRLTFDWDTRNVSPGEYRIRAEAYVWEDTSPFDNKLDVSQPVVLVSPGSTFPGRAEAGGSVTETDPRFGKHKLGE